MARLLMIGEDPSTSEIPMVIAASAGHEIAFVRLAELERVLERDAPDAILVEADQALPLSRVLHQMPRKVPVIALAPPLATEEGFAMQQLGIKHLLTKPYAARELIAAIQAVLEPKGSRTRHHVVTSLLNLMSLGRDIEPERG